MRPGDSVTRCAEQIGALIGLTATGVATIDTLRHGWSYADWVNAAIIRAARERMQGPTRPPAAAEQDSSELDDADTLERPRPDLDGYEYRKCALLRDDV